MLISRKQNTNNTALDAMLASTEDAAIQRISQQAVLNNMDFAEGPLKRILRSLSESGELAILSVKQGLEPWLVAIENVLMSARIVSTKTGMPAPKARTSGIDMDIGNAITIITAALADSIGIIQRFVNGTPTIGGVAMGHMPEVYLSWLLALNSEEMFNQPDEMSIDLKVKPV